MDNIIKTGKKAFTISVVVTTIAWSIGLAALVAPLAASAALPSAPALIKASGAAVYFYAEDGKRYVFPNQKTFDTWYADFGSVITVTDDELASISIGGNVTYKPGVKMIKITTDPKSYAVGANGTLRWVKTEAVAKALYGDNWNQQISDVPDAFFTNYTPGTEIAAAADFDKVAVTAAATSISVDKGISETATPVATPAAGAVTVSAVSLAAGSVPYSAADAIVAQFKVAFTGDAKTITKIVAERTGLAADANITWVKAYKGTTQHGTSQSLNSSHQVNLSSLAMSVSNGDTVTVAVDVAALNTATAGHVFAIKVVEVVFADGSTVSGLPLAGPNMTVSSVTIGTATLSNGPLGTRNTTNLTVDSDATDVRFTQVRIMSGAAEGAVVKQIVAIKNGTAAATDVKNVRLKDDTAGKILGTVASLTNERAVFDVNVPIAKGESNDFSILADVAGGAGRTVTFDLHDGSVYKISVVGATFGFGITPTRNDFCALAGTCTAQGINQGYLTFQKSSQTPATGNVPLGATQEELFVLDGIVRGEAINVTSTQLTIDLTHTPASGGSAADYTNVTGYDGDGNILFGPQDGTTAGANTDQTLTFTDAYTLPTGTTSIHIKANISSSAVAGETVAVSMPVNTVTGRGAQSGKTTYTTSAGTTVPPAAVVTGNTMAINGPTLQVITASVPIAGSQVVNAQDAIFAYIDLDASASGENVQVATVMVQDTLGGGATVYTGLNNLELWGDPDNTDDTSEDKKLDTSSSTSTNAATTTFTFLTPITVAKGTISRLTLKLDIVTSDTDGGAVADTHTFAVAGAATVTATGLATNSAITETYDGAGQAQTIQASGTLKVEKAADMPAAALLVSGSTGNLGAKYKLTTQYEPVDVTQFTIATEGARAGANLDNIKVYKIASAETQIGAVGGYTLDSGGDALVTLSSGTLVIPKDSYAYVVMKFDLVDKAALTSGDTVEIGFGDSDGDDSEWGDNAVYAAGNYQIVATGQNSGATIAQANIDHLGTGAGNVAGGYQHALYDGLLTISLNASSPSGTQTPGAGKEVLRLDLTATGDEVTAHELDIVKGGTCTVTGDTIAKLQSTDGSTTYADWTITDLLEANFFVGGTSAALGTSATDAFETGETAAWDSTLSVGAGSTVTVKLTGDTTGCTTNETLQYSVTDGTGTTSGIQWYDNQLTSANAVDSTLTPHLPVNGGGLTF